MPIDWYTYIKGFYEDGLWTKKQVHDVVAADGSRRNNTRKLPEILTILIRRQTKTKT
ncbi:hypothetical protein S100027_04660 (plasmid) [Bacillus licheniformis]|nr:hypothetical protein S100027_04660 [Bacillus licheniformis]